MEKHLKICHESEKKSTNSIQALHDIAELCHKRSLVVIFTDLMDNPERETAFFPALQHVKHNKHKVIVFHVVDKKMEIDFELENRPYTLVDMETAERMKLQPAAMKEKYAEAIQAYFEQIKLKCANYKIDFMPADIKAGYHDVLLKFLLKRQKMR